MLVLSRRTDQSINFPTLGVSIRILRIAGQTVRVGVQAPRSLPILRDELDTSSGEAASTIADEERARQARHDLRSRLNTTTMALYLAQRQLRAGSATDADGMLQKALGELERLERELTARTEPQPRPAHRPIRTLLVEDNAQESALLGSYLRLNGMDVANASDGQEALDYLSTHEPPDAVLLDMRMPRCDGPSTLVAIRGNPAYSRLKIFAVSGAKPEEMDVPTPVDGWFTKPLNPAQLVDTLALAVG